MIADVVLSTSIFCPKTISPSLMQPYGRSGSSHYTHIENYKTSGIQSWWTFA